MKTCFDEGTLQAYLDGELSRERAGEVAAHLATCELCADAVREAAQEFAMIATALGADEPLSVPTESLRTRINAAIAEMQPTSAASHVASTSLVASASLFERLRARAASLAAQLAFVPRQATAFASFLVAAALLATIFFVFRPQTRAPQKGQPQEIARVNPPTSVGGGSRQNGAKSNDERRADEHKQLESDSAGGVETAAPRGVNRVSVERAKFVVPNDPRAGNGRGAAPRTNDDKAAGGALMPVEQPYVNAIASLKSSIDQQRGAMMTPTLRAEYERNLAVVDRAIVASRVAVRRDPADKDAQEFLRAAYQDKLDLLHAVADQTQIASIGR
jgi:anti-sigma factor RsiW